MRRLQILGGLAGGAILASNLADAWREMAAHPVPVAWPRVIVATLLLVAVYAGLAGMWRLMAAELGARVSFATALQFWSISNLGRYVPGKVWQITGVVLVASSFGVAPGIAAVISVLAFGLMIATGALVGGAFLPGLLPAAILAAVWILAGLGVIVPIARPQWLRAAMRRFPGFLRVTDPVLPTPFGMARIVAAFFAMWIAHGFAFWVFCTAFTRAEWRAIPGCTGAFCSAYVAGLAALIAPGGIGVREEILGAALARVLPAAPVHVVAVSARLWTMAAELAVLLWALGWRARAPRSAS